MTTTKVGVVCLGEAGNLGDDLILIATVRALLAADAGCHITFLSNGQELDWEEIAGQLGLPRLPTRARVRRELLWVGDNRRLLSGSDLVVFGGGGLLQTSHQPDRIYWWLRYIPPAGDRPPVLAVGHGLGPIHRRWIARLQRLGDPFNESWVRDDYSLELCRDKLNWEASRCQDFVDSDFIKSLVPALISEKKKRSVLGVALRAWDGLDSYAVADHIQRVAKMHKCEHVQFFVLESKSGLGCDMEFSRDVARAVAPLSVSVRIYDPASILDFVAAMSEVDIAISMKLHSCAVWSAYGVPIYPVYYAPKVASFFGRAFTGLEISDEIVRPLDLNESIPSAFDVISSRLDHVRREPARRMAVPFRATERARFRATRTFRSLVRRIPFMGGRA